MLMGGQPVSVGSLPDLSPRASKGEAVDKVNKKVLENFRRQWLDELEQNKATRSDDDEDAVADMSLAEAFELRDQQACLKKRRKELKPSAVEPPMVLGLLTITRGAGNPTTISERPRHDRDDSEFDADHRSLELPSTEQPLLG